MTKLLALGALPVLFVFVALAVAAVLVVIARLGLAIGESDWRPGKSEPTGRNRHRRRQPGVTSRLATAARGLITAGR